MPKTVSTDILVEPTVKNPLRELSSVTQITNLETATHFTLDDDDFIATPKQQKK
nr:hypothetical protein [Paenibacillus larvae]